MLFLTRKTVVEVDFNNENRILLHFDARISTMTARDRTHAFRASCARGGGGAGGDASDNAPVSSARERGIRNRNQQRTTTNKDADAKTVTCETVRECARAASGALAATRSYVETHRKAYARADDATRDAFEAETSASIGECQRCVARAKDAVEAARAPGGALSRSPQCAAHLFGIGLILSESLNELARMFDRVRESRFASALARAERERERRRPAKRATHAAFGVSWADDRVGDDVDGVHVEGVERQTQVHEERQDALEEELTQLLEQVRVAERNVLEMSALSSLFATHVQAQAEQIESLYQDAIESSRHLDVGNVEMRKTIARKGSAQKWVALFLLIAALALLFLDWYSG